jgi:hypothetical protein
MITGRTRSLYKLIEFNAPFAAVNAHAHLAAIENFWLARVSGSSSVPGWPDWDVEAIWQLIEQKKGETGDVHVTRCKPWISPS